MSVIGQIGRTLGAAYPKDGAVEQEMPPVADSSLVTFDQTDRTFDEET